MDFIKFFGFLQVGERKRVVFDRPKSQSLRPCVIAQYAANEFYLHANKTRAYSALSWK